MKGVVYKNQEYKAGELNFDGNLHTVIEDSSGDYLFFIDDTSLQIYNTKEQVLKEKLED